MAVIPAGVLASASKHEAVLAHVQRALSAARQGGVGSVTPFFEDGVHPSGPKWLTAWAKQNPEGHILETQIQAEPPHGGGRNATLAQTWDYLILLIEEHRPGTYRRISILVREYGPANYRIVLASKMEESQNLSSYQDFHRHLRSSSRFREHGWHRQGAWEVALEVQRMASPTDVPYRQFTPETAFAHFKSVVAKIQRGSARSDAELRRTVRDEPLNALRKWVAANPKLEVIGYEAEDMGRGRIELRCQVRHGTQQQTVRVWIDQFGQWTLTFFESGPLSAATKGFAPIQARGPADEKIAGNPTSQLGEALPAGQSNRLLALFDESADAQRITWFVMACVHKRQNDALAYFALPGSGGSRKALAWLRSDGAAITDNLDIGDFRLTHLGDGYILSYPDPDLIPSRLRFELTESGPKIVEILR